jgi:hypothetical protein
MSEFQSASSSGFCSRAALRRAALLHHAEGRSEYDDRRLASPAASAGSQGL